MNTNNATAENPLTEAVQKAAKKKAVRYTPEADADFSTVITNVNDAWKANTQIKLLWITQPEFETMVTGFNQSLQSRKSDGGNRPSQTSTLKNLNAQMDKGVQEVKTCIAYKFKKANATAQYARYGIVKENRAYVLPKDNDERLKALPLMIAAIAADGFGNEEYGTAFWTGIEQEFTTALKAASTTDGKVTGSVSTKGVAKKGIIKAMNALRLTLEANYPDTYKAVYREWGWQKEKY